MLAGRYGLETLALITAEQFATQRRVVASRGTPPMDSLTVALLLLATIVLAAAVSFLPVLALGPIVEMLQH
jgi:K+-transporting ATPase ATPase A chain